MTNHPVVEHLSKSTTSTVAFTDLTDSTAAGIFIGKHIAMTFKYRPADAVIVFASSRHDYPKLLAAIQKASKTKVLIGCTSAGEFINKSHGEGSVSAVAFRSKDIKFSASIGRTIKSNAAKAARDVVKSFHGMNDDVYPYRSALVLADTLAGHTDDVIESLYKATTGTYQFFGGGAGDDGEFDTTYVFLGTKVYTNAVVALEILSKKPIGIAVRHGWKEASGKMRITESEGVTLVSLNAIPILDIFRQHAIATNQTFDENDPCEFFLQNPVGVKTDNGYKLRAPLGINDDGSISFGSDLPTGSIVSIMKATSRSSARAAREATKDALRQLGNHKPSVALLFDCVATRLRTEHAFDNELAAVTDSLNS
ncbi:MAG TPA: FIST N-terminal domain-containing protein, partial [Candidatus Saccharimonadales bacterium]|nr:FIST N-terminal domain-containing protein [Candidatus Saccharimonadales bacterium]